MSKYEYELSKYEDEWDEDYVICPYCEHKYQPEAESYSEDVSEETCGECGKKYTLYQEFSVTHRTSPDCKLNGQAHVWELKKLRGGRSHDFCETCGACKGINDE